jgi:hypothetical protein
MPRVLATQVFTGTLMSTCHGKRTRNCASRSSKSDHRCYGSRRVIIELQKLGVLVNRKRVMKNQKGGDRQKSERR